MEFGDWEAVRRIAAEAGPEASVAVGARVVGTDRRWELNGELAFPAASTIKAAILVALYREVDTRRLDLETEVDVTPEAKVPGSGVLMWMRDGLRLTVADLACLMIAVSDNTASNVLLNLVGMDRVRATIADVGLSGTALNRRFLGRAPAPDEPDNWTTAADLAALFEAIATDRAAAPASCAAMRATLALQQHRDRVPRLLPRTTTMLARREPCRRWPTTPDWLLRRAARWPSRS